MPRSSSTGMPRRRNTKRALLNTHLAESQPAIIDENVWAELQVRLAPVSNGYLRELVIATGLPMSPIVEAVRQDSFEQAERTLIALTQAYVEAAAERRKRIRGAVIDSKDRLRWSLKRPDPMKQEILLWVMTWLENPEIFPTWLALRRRAEATAPLVDAAIESE
jgi:hypothetical protein